MFGILETPCLGSWLDLACRWHATLWDLKVHVGPYSGVHVLFLAFVAWRSSCLLVLWSHGCLVCSPDSPTSLCLSPSLLSLFSCFTRLYTLDQAGLRYFVCKRLGEQPQTRNVKEILIQVGPLIIEPLLFAHGGHAACGMRHHSVCKWLGLLPFKTRSRSQPLTAF